MIDYFKDFFGTGDNTKTIKAFERERAVKFPGLYKQLVSRIDGGYLKRNIFFCTDPKNNRTMRDSVGCFLAWGDYPYELFRDLVDSPPEFFPEGLIAFASNGGGDFICFDYRNCKENPPIVFWHHEYEENEGIFPLADNFEEFLDDLKSDEEMEN